MQPSRPKMATVVLSIALLVVGFLLVFYQGTAIEIVRGLPIPNDITRQIVALMTEKLVAYAALAASPILLIIGSLLPNI